LIVLGALTFLTLLAVLLVLLRRRRGDQWDPSGTA
jgi:hypothetical protein